MHAYLIVGNSETLVEKEVQNIVKKEKSTLLEFPIEKINDTRELSKFLKLKIIERTAILIKNVDNSTTEALNAFLKNLEEPQVDVIFILTARNEYGVIPTILSRCQLVKTEFQSDQIKIGVAKSFLVLTEAEKLLEISQIKAREEAVLYIQNLISSLHLLLVKGMPSVSVTRYLAKAEDALKALNANGNVALQLANFVINR